MFKRIIFIFCMFALSNVSAQTTCEVKLQGDYATIDTQKDIGLIEVLLTEKVSKKEKLKAASEIEKNPGNYTPPVLVALGGYYFSNKDIRKAAFWVRAGMFRSLVDIKIHHDPSLEDMPYIFYAQIRAIANKFIKTQSEKDKFEKELKLAAKKIINWDKCTPRNYDDRWVCLHSIRAFVETKIADVSQEDKQRIIENEYLIFAEATKSEH